MKNGQRHKKQLSLYGAAFISIKTYKKWTDEVKVFRGKVFFFEHYYTNYVKCHYFFEINKNTEVNKIFIIPKLMLVLY